MALVIRSERDFKLSSNASGVIGPGDYDKNNSCEKIIQNQAPFNSRSLRLFKFTENSNNNSEIGPGSYYQPKQRTFIRKSFNRNRSSFEKITKKDLYNIALYKVVKTKKEIKIKEQKSLVIDKDNRNQVMKKNRASSTIDVKGPSDIWKAQDKRFYKLVPTTLTKNRVNSIPSKKCFLGYDFDQNGQPIIVDPSLFITNNKENKEENEKNNIISKKKDKINAIDWSKMSKKEISHVESTTKNETINNNNISSSIVNYNNSTTKEYNGLSINTTNASNIKQKGRMSSNETSGINKINNKCLLNSNESIASFTNNEITSDKNSSGIYKSLLDDHSQGKSMKSRGTIFRIKNRDIRLKTKKISIEDFVYDNLFKGDPGPGYYQEQSDFDKYNLLSNRYRHFNFGSNEEKCKNNYYRLSDNVNIGPGQYFKERNTPKFKALFFPLCRKEETINIKKYEKDLVNENMGPGKYDFKSQFDKTQLYYSGPLEKRFLEKYKGIKPGPGEYIQLENWEKNNVNENQLLKPNIFANIKKFEENNEKKEEKGRYGYISKNENPGVGDYNPHIVNSIRYDIISRDNKISNLIAPFCSGQEKFLKKSSSTSDLVGPGSYFPNINTRNNSYKKEDKKGNHLYKIDGMKNDNIKLLYNQNKSDIESQVGPGSYDLHNYNEWYKKSFNALYV